MNRVIISYRSDDTPEACHRAEQIYQILSERLGPDEIVLGVDNLVPAGADPAGSIAHILSDAYVLLIVMGEQWQFGTWLRDPHNPDHIAITSALRAGIRVIPVLADDVALLTAGELPGDFALLSRQIPVVISTSDPQRDLEKLVAIVKRRFPKDYTPPEPIVPPVILQQPRRRIPQPPVEPREKSAPGKSAARLISPRTSSMPAITAFLYPFTTDNNWVIKLGIAALFSLLPFIGNLMVVGYSVRAGRRVADDMAGLPEWDDFLGDFLRGLTIFAGIVMHIFLFMLPILIITTPLLEIGATTVYSDILGMMIRQPGPVGLLLSLAAFAFFAYYFIIMHQTALALFLEQNRFGVFLDFGVMWKEARSSFRRNIAYILNVFFFNFIVLTSLYFLASRLVFLGMFISAWGTIGSYYLVAYWLYTIRRNSDETKTGQHA